MFTPPSLAQRDTSRKSNLRQLLEQLAVALADLVEQDANQHEQGDLILSINSPAETGKSRRQFEEAIKSNKLHGWKAARGYAARRADVEKWLLETTTRRAKKPPTDSDDAYASAVEKARGGR